MEAVVLIGIQGSGKTTFYLERFFDTHVRISLDMLRTRVREEILIRACIAAKQPFVVDNTNVLIVDRTRYIGPGNRAGFRVVGYFFHPELREALRRNAARPGKRAIPAPGVISAFKRLEPPSLGEGFDEIFDVTIDPDGAFIVRPWVG